MAKKPAKVKKPAKKAAKKAARPAKVAQSKVQRSAAPTLDKIRTSIRPKNSSTGALTYSEFLENLKGFCGLTKRSEAKALAEDIQLLIKDSLRRGYKIPLFGLGKMYVRQSKARTGRNPATGEVIQISARKRVRFTAAKALKEAVLK